MSQDEEESNSDPTMAHGYKPGTIKYLKLVNFMCHESFEIRFGPKVNFIIGPNGSGKSALLTALVVVLGGRASTTSRAKRASDFIQYGKNYAKITCILHNYDKVMQIDRAFKPDEYGKEIFIEKTILKDDSARLVLKSDQGKRVSERKQELDDVLEHFGIGINNPICILNQEISKTFLHSRRPEDKFDLFMKATTLEQTEQDYINAKQTHQEWKDCNERKSLGYRLLDKEYQSCKEKVGFLLNRTKLQEQMDNVNTELMWAYIRDKENASDSITEKVTKIKDTLASSEASISKREEKIGDSKLIVEQQNIKLQACQEGITTSKKKCDDLRTKDLQVRNKQIDLNQTINEKKRRIDRLEKDASDLKKAIREEKRKFEEQNAFSQDTDSKIAEIERLDKELKADQARESTITQHSEQLTNSMIETRSELHKMNMKISNLRNEISAHEATLRRLKGGQVDELKKYSEFMPALVEEIESAHQARKFKKKPLGPIGHHIKLKTPDIAGALELHLGRTAHSFICDNFEDMQILHSIYRKLRANIPYFKDPMVIIRLFTKRHDTSKFKAAHPNYKTLSDLIEVDEDPVFNVLCDRSNLESVLFIPDYFEAEALMLTESQIPNGTRCAYTKDCHTMYPKTINSGYKSIAPNPKQSFCLFKKGNSDQIQTVERERDNLKAELRDAEHIAEKLKVSLDSQRGELNRNANELREIRESNRVREDRLMQLKTNLPNVEQPQQIAALEDELDSVEGRIQTFKVELGTLSESMAQIQSELKDISNERQEAEKIRLQREKERDTVLTSIRNEKDLIKKHRVEIEQTLAAVKKLEQDLKDREIELESLSVEIQAMREVSRGNRPNQIRVTEVIQAELKKIERLLATEIEDNADPDELEAQLKKRMKEIESIKDLRDHNLMNYDLCKQSISEREEGFGNLKMQTSKEVTSTFASILGSMNMSGRLFIYFDDRHEDGQLVAKAKTLVMSIDTTQGSATQRPTVGLQAANENSASSRRTARSQPNVSVAASGDNPDNDRDLGPSSSKRARLQVSPNEKENMRMTDTRSLSGGERSFSTVAFVLSLWHHCSSPFKVMDEIDVFMDMVTRRVSYTALITFARVEKNGGQFIYFSPLELPNFTDECNLVRVFEMPRIIRKGVQLSSQEPGTSAAAAAASAP